MSEKSKQHNPQKYYSLLELTRSIESVIKKTYTRSYWVKAEIVKLNYYPKSGHCYPDLVEKENGRILAQMRGTIWAGQFTQINNKFLSVTKEPLTAGMTVLIRTSVSFHPVYGLGLHINDIEPSFTLGEMAKEKLISIEKLKQLGIFDQNKRLAPPLLMKRIAVISVETSKGYHDFKNIIDNNSWGYSFFYMLFPALLQGDGAVNSIISQLNRIKKAAHFFDAVIIIRGGGGDVGLSCYDSFKLSKAVAIFPLPIISGIGHATNETVVELVVYNNKITPTDVAYYLIQKFHNYLSRVQEAHRTIINKSNQITDSNHLKINNLGTLLQSKSKALLFNKQTQLASTTHKFNLVSKSFIDNNKNKFMSLLVSLKHKPKLILSLQNSTVVYHQKQLTLSAKSLLLLNSSKLIALADKQRILDPKNILKRGYSITSHNSKIIFNSNELNNGDIIKTQTYKGSFESKIISKTKEE